MKQFTRCKKLALKDSESPAVSAETLELCFDEVTTDSQGKIEKAEQKIVDTFNAKFTELEAVWADLLPGDCGQGETNIVDFSNCMVNAGKCRVCQLFNAADYLREECDAFDDTLPNGSCVAGG